jgi:maltokinase
MREGWPQVLDGLLPEYLAAQRWYHGTVAPEAASVSVKSAKRLWADGESDRAMWQVLVSVGDDCYQLIVGERPAGERSEFLHGHEESVVGSAAGSVFYDVTVDPDMSKHLLETASAGREHARIARPVSVEQSNTSLVFDDRLIFKLFRRLRPGPNPDVEVSTALARVGFAHVAPSVVEWREGDYDLGFGQEYLTGGTDGWALALTSLRDLYDEEGPGLPAEAGGDFASEAERLGRVTAEMHVALHEAFGESSASAASVVWDGLVGGLEGRLRDAGQRTGHDFWPSGASLVARLESLDGPGPMMRVHGDFHLGQVMRTDTGWFVLDFEGEPARPVDERVAPASPLKDVTSMLRSFHYASRHALSERTRAQLPGLIPLAEAWDSRNRSAFLDGYSAHPGIHALLPEPAAMPAVMAAYELDKALYELGYELGHRPEWVYIPVEALASLVEGKDPLAGIADPPAGGDPPA